MYSSPPFSGSIPMNHPPLRIYFAILKLAYMQIYTSSLPTTNLLASPLQPPWPSPLRPPYPKKWAPPPGTAYKIPSVPISSPFIHPTQPQHRHHWAIHDVAHHPTTLLIQHQTLSALLVGFHRNLQLSFLEYPHLTRHLQHHRCPYHQCFPQHMTLYTLFDFGTCIWIASASFFRGNHNLHYLDGAESSAIKYSLRFSKASRFGLS